MSPKTKVLLAILGTIAVIALLAVAAWWAFYFIMFSEGHPGGAPRG